MLAPAADWKEEQRNKTKRQRTVLLATLPMAFCVLLLRIPTGPMVAVLDVGQGDGIYLRTPEGLDLFIDGGSTDIGNVGKYRLLPFLQYHGVGCVDYWFLSHLDKDHVSGMEELIEEGFPVRAVVLAEGIVRDSAYERLVKLLEQQGISLVFLPSDQSVGNGSFRLTCLLPGEETDPSGKDRNARSMVLLYEMGSFRGLFTGDISAREEQELCRDQRIQGLTFYKAAHHGSNYSNSAELMEWAKPVATAVSCAKKNDYGHPGGEAVSRMEEHSGAVYYTMDSGQVSLVWDRTGRMRIARKLR